MRNKTNPSPAPTPQQALRQLSALCVRQECCAYELLQRMKRKGMGESDAQQVIRTLLDEGFLDESRYCRSFVHDKLEISRWGRLRIQRELRLCQLPPAKIQAALDEVEESRYREVLNELLAAYNRTLRARSSYERWGKLVRYAMGRGFEQDLASQVARKLVQHAEEDDQ